MAGKTIEESKQACHRDQDAGHKILPMPTSSQLPWNKVSVKIQGADGHASYMLINAQHLTSPTAPLTTTFSNTAAPSSTIPVPTTQIDTAEYHG